MSGFKISIINDNFRPTKPLHVGFAAIYSIVIVP